MTNFTILKTIAVTSLILANFSGWAASCKVIDPELQGTYTGPCDNKGFAYGTGSASGTAKYDGEFRNGKKQGFGKKQWPKTGDTYVGEFDDDYRHGYGTYSWGKLSPYAGQQYIGDYVKDFREGFGTYHWPNGDKFTGNWKRDIRYGMSYMEIRRQIAHQLHQEAIQHPGQLVCRNAPYGISKTVFLSGTVTNVQDNSVTVDLSEEAAATGLYLTKTINIDSEIELWSPCAS